MNRILPYLKQDFDRVYKKLDDTKFKELNLISYEDVLKAHYLIADYFHNDGEEIVYGVKDLNILGSALGRQLTGFGSYQKWNRSEEICATLFYGLIKNHAFHDGNKRTALLVLLYHLYRQGKTINVKQREFENLAVRIAADDYEAYRKFLKYKHMPDSKILFIADFLRNSTYSIDKKAYTITYQELDTLLRKYDCYLSDASGNFINVIKIKKEKFLGVLNKEKPVRVLQIGFHGWKRQIHPKALKEVLKATELTAENGFDSQVFFKGAEPLYSLIDEYRGPLKRLKDR